MYTERVFAPRACVRNVLLLALVPTLAAAPAVAGVGCGQCDFLITGRDGDSYTASRGYAVCVDESAIFTGSVTLKGGTFEVCGVAMPSTVAFEPGGGRIVNHGTLRVFSLDLSEAEVENHRVLLTYGDLTLGPGARLANLEGGFVGVGGELRNGGALENQGVLDTSGELTNAGRCESRGLISARRFDNAGELYNRGRINASELFHNAEGATFESHGGTLATLDLLNEGLLFGEPGNGCNSLLVANRWQHPARGQLLGALDLCAAGMRKTLSPGLGDHAAQLTTCACFNP